LNVFNYIVFTFFLSSDGPRVNNQQNTYGGGNDSNNNGSNDDERNTNQSTNQQLQTAFSYFETAASDSTRDSIKKQYKRLSKIHHPDRNDNSKESTEEMQKINAYYELLEKEFDRRDGVIGDGLQDDYDDKQGRQTNTKPSQKQNKNDPDEPGISPSERKRRHKMQQRANAKARKHRETEIRNERRRMEEEMQREWRETKRRAAELKEKEKKLAQEKQKIRKESRRQGDTKYRATKEDWDAAHIAWKARVKEMETREAAMKEEAMNRSNPRDDMSGIDEDRPVRFMLHPILPPERPENAIMELCSDVVVVALRVGSSEIAMELVHEQIGAAVNKWVTDRLVDQLRKGEPPDTMMKIDDSFKDAMLSTLLRPLDDDGNHVLHYAVYMEDNGMISYLIDEARKVERFAEFVVSANARGQTVLDYSFVDCFDAKDITIPGRVQALWDESTEVLESRKLGPTFQRFARKLVPTGLHNLEPTFYTICALAVGMLLFKCGWPMSIVIAGFARTEDPYGAIGVPIFAYHALWLSVKAFLRLLWTLFTLLFPTWVYCRVAVLLACCFLFKSPLFVLFDWLMSVEYYVSRGFFSVVRTVDEHVTGMLPRSFYYRFHKLIQFVIMGCLMLAMKLAILKFVVATIDESDVDSDPPVQIPVPLF
jgi:curved DNA-binding protein CbpA